MEGDDVVPEAEPTAAVAEDAGAPPKNGKQTPPTRREVQANAKESREEALSRAFGDAVDDDDLLAGVPDAGPSDEELLAEPEPQPDKSPERAAGISPEQYAALQSKVEALERRLADERERQQDPEEEIEIDYDVDVDPGFESLKPTFKAVGERAERQNRELTKQLKEHTEVLFKMQGKLDLQDFKSERPDFWARRHEVAAMAEAAGMELYDYKTLLIADDLYLGRKAMARLKAAESRAATESKMKEKAGPVRAFRAPQQQVRDEEVSPGSKKLSFNEAWDKGLAKLQRSQRRG